MAILLYFNLQSIDVTVLNLRGAVAVVFALLQGDSSLSGVFELTELTVANSI